MLTRARRRLVPGAGYKDVPPSPFLRLIPPRLLRQDAGAGVGPSPFQERLAARQRPASTWQAPTGLSRAPSPLGAASSPAVPPSPPPLARQAGLFGPGSSPLRPDEGQEAPAEDNLRTVRPEDPSLFVPGTEVLHPTLGRGTIQERQGSPANLKLVVFFPRHGRKQLMLRHANLEIILP